MSVPKLELGNESNPGSDISYDKQGVPPCTPQKQITK